MVVIDIGPSPVQCLFSLIAPQPPDGISHSEPKAKECTSSTWRRATLPRSYPFWTVSTTPLAYRYRSPPPPPSRWSFRRQAHTSSGPCCHGIQGFSLEGPGLEGTRQEADEPGVQLRWA